VQTSLQEGSGKKHHLDDDDGEKHDDDEHDKSEASSHSMPQDGGVRRLGTGVSAAQWTPRMRTAPRSPLKLQVTSLYERMGHEQAEAYNSKNVVAQMADKKLTQPSRRISAGDPKEHEDEGGEDEDADGEEAEKPAANEEAEE